MLSYIEPLPRKNSINNVFEWTLAQTEELQLHSLAALTILLPVFLNEYFEYHAGTRLLLFYEWTISDGKFLLNTSEDFDIFFLQTNFEVKETVFLAKEVETINDLNYDTFFVYSEVFCRLVMNASRWIYAIKESFHRSQVSFIGMF